MLFSDRAEGHRGAVAELICVSAQVVAHMPASLSFTQAVVA
jgi:NADPH:quinone reductase-like Zn-dependent oxidoreductase